MGWSTIGLILVGVLASSSIIVARKPNAKELIDKLVPYQGWIGVINFFWGAWFTIWLVMNMSLFVQHVPVRFAVWGANAVAMLLLGFLMGFGLISKYALSKNEAAMQKGQAIRAKLAKLQGPLGLFGIAAGIAGFVFCFLTF
jgi:hypothetical protein